MPKPDSCDKTLEENNVDLCVYLWTLIGRTSVNSAADQKVTEEYLSCALDGLFRTIFTDGQYPVIMKS